MKISWYRSLIAPILQQNIYNGKGLVQGNTADKIELVNSHTSTAEQDPAKSPRKIPTPSKHTS